MVVASCQAVRFGFHPRREQPFEVESIDFGASAVEEEEASLASEGQERMRKLIASTLSLSLFPKGPVGCAEPEQWREFIGWG